jgi:hypothetical protein
MVSGYALEYCNKFSIQGGLKPYYNIIKNKKDSHNKGEYNNLYEVSCQTLGFALVIVFCWI